MEKNTVIAIVLSAVILLGGTYISGILRERNAPPETAGTDTEVREAEQESAVALPADGTTEEFSVSGGAPVVKPGNDDFDVKTIVEETDNFRISFSTAGGVARELELVSQLDAGRPVSMVLDGDGDVGTFNIAFGGPDQPYLTDAFKHKRVQRGREIIHNFSRDYQKDGQDFTLTKSYRIIPGEYLVELIVSLESSDGKAVPLLDGNEPAYTLTYGPQIGPTFKKIDGRYEIRDNVTWGPDSRNGRIKRVTHKNRSKFVQTGNTVKWAGVVGKYFAVVVEPGSGSTLLTWDNRPADGQTQASRMQISRPARRQSIIEDTYRFYIGPLDKANLSRYESREANAFGVSGMGLMNVPKTSSVLGWLEKSLQFLLELFYRMIPNYGVAIILLTVLVKAILFPITRKTYSSTSKMQAIQPKLKELQKQYKGDPQKLNAKTAELYKAEGVNPLGGCLPMLLQFPIFIALYGLLNRYFPLRGAAFIPGWIIDLSAPEFIWREFEKPLKLLLISIPAIRILPVLYLGGQLLMTKVTQQGSAGAQTGMQQKMFTVVMPIMFFFILYNMPSGLLLYWTAMNFITVGQQLVTNYLKKRRSVGGTA